MKFHDLIRLLDQQPQWRAELRRVLLTEELLSLPEIIRELAEAQRRTETIVQKLIRRTDRLIEEVGHLKGAELGRRYRERAPSYFARILRRIHALSIEEVAALVDAADARGELEEAERDELLRADLIVHGLRCGDGAESYLAVAISAGMGMGDVTHAAERAHLLAKLTGKPVIAVVAGKSITKEAAARAAELGAWRVLDGQVLAP